LTGFIDGLPWQMLSITARFVAILSTWEQDLVAENFRARSKSSEEVLISR
jgi:hypothetical protein